MYRLCHEKRSLDTGRYCDTVPNGSQYLNHVTVVVLSRLDTLGSARTNSYSSKRLCVTKIFFKKKAFCQKNGGGKKEKKEKKITTFHIHTLTNTKTDAECGSVHVLFARLRRIKHTVAAESYNVQCKQKGSASVKW